MLISSLCAPAIVYIGFSLIQIIIDIYKGVYNAAFIKFIIMIILSTIINILCDLGLTVIAWFLVFIPIIMMTIISTLLLNIFGVNPDEKDLHSKIRYLSDKESKEIVSGSNLLNQQKYAFFYDRFNSVKRIDRDEIREDMYDKLDEKVDFDKISKKYDISYDDVEYSVADYYINLPEQNNYMNNVNYTTAKNNFNRFLSLFSLKNYYNDNNTYKINNNNNNNNNNDNNNNNINDNDNDNNNNNNNNNNIKSYNKTYENRYKLDGYLLYKDYIYNKTKNRLEKKYPNISDLSVDKEVERQWNKLSQAEQSNWESQADNDN